MLLPYIEKDQALAIVSFRSKNGLFNDVSILLRNGILEQTTYEAIRPYLKIKNPSSQHFIGRNETGDRVLSTSALETSLPTKPGEIQVLQDQEYYDNLLNAINNAAGHINIAMFFFKTTDSSGNRPTKIVNRLIAASKRGVRIKVLLEHSDYNENVTRENKKVARKLRQNGIEVLFDSPKITTHTKIVVIDHRYVFIGSHNFTHYALSKNHEVSLRIDSTDLAEEMLDYLHDIQLVAPDSVRLKN